jgi:transposase
MRRRSPRWLDAAAASTVPSLRRKRFASSNRTDEPLATIARELGVTRASLHGWVDAARPEPREPLTEDERSELLRLRRETRQLRMERDILKKATAFFARHSE